MDNAVHTSIERLLQLRKLGGEIKLHSPKRAQSHIDGDIATRFRGRGMEFAEVRPYNPGDDIRTIDWRVTARTQITHTKLFQEEHERPVFVLVDQRSSMFFGTKTVFKSVFAAELAACLAWAALANNDRIGAFLFSDTQIKDIRPKRGKHALLNVLHHMHQFNNALNSPINANGTTSLDEQLEDLARIAKPGSTIYIISDFHDIKLENTGTKTAPIYQHRALTQLTRHNDVNLFKVFDPLEAQLPSNALCTFSNGKDRVQIDTSSQNAKTYKEQFNQRNDALLQASRHGASFFKLLDISQPIEQILNTLFIVGKQRGGRK